ncbi:hypothetical protein ACFLV7_02840 [Chloroflexota bacterium]
MLTTAHAFNSFPDSSFVRCPHSAVLIIITIIKVIVVTIIITKLSVRMELAVTTPTNSKVAFSANLRS